HCAAAGDDPRADRRDGGADSPLPGPDVRGIPPAWLDRGVSMEKINWHDRAIRLSIDGRAFVNGERSWAVSGRKFDNLSPIDGRYLAQVARCDASDVDLAVSKARAAFEDGRWSHKAPAQRKKILMRFGELMMQNIEELALLETLDM